MRFGEQIQMWEFCFEVQELHSPKHPFKLRKNKGHGKAHERFGKEEIKIYSFTPFYAKGKALWLKTTWHLLLIN